MRRPLLIAAAIALVAACVIKPVVRVARPPYAPADAQAVHGTAVIHEAHCGGALATAETTANSTRPGADLTLRLQLGHQNLAAPAIAVLQTDDAGTFEAWLSPGEYCVVLKARSREGGRAPAPPAWADVTGLTAECLEKLAALCDGVLSVKTGQSEVWADLNGKVCAWNNPCGSTAPTPAQNPLP